MHLSAVHVQVGGEHQNVVKVDEDEEVEEVTEDILDQSLKYCWCTGQTKRHCQIFVMSLWCVKCCLPLISFWYAN